MDNQRANELYQMILRGETTGTTSNTVNSFRAVESNSDLRTIKSEDSQVLGGDLRFVQDGQSRLEK